MTNSNNKDGFFAAILFFVWPFLAAVSAVYNFRKPWAKNIMWAFVAFYGFTFAIGSESEGSDIVRYVAEYQELHRMNLDFAGAVNYYEERGRLDVVRAVIALTLSWFTDSQPMLTLVYAIIFGYFFSRNMWYVMERLKGKLSPITIILLACFFLTVPMWYINGFRMWTAAHVFMYGLLPYLFEGRKNGIWISALSILFHFSFIVPVAALIGFAMTGSWLTLSFSIFIASIFMAEIDLAVFNRLIESYAPEIIQENTAGYRVEDDGPRGEQVAADERSRRWYAVWYRRALGYAVMAFLIGLFISGRKYIEEHQGWLNLFCFVLLFYAAANFMGSFASSGRFLRLANFFALPLIILYVQNVPQEKMMKRLAIFLTPALLLFIIVSVRIGIYTISAKAILSNPVIAVFIMDELLSLNDLMRMIL
jgi:hypothetical protein